MPDYKQDQRLLSITTPLGPNELLLAGFSGTETLSRLFQYQLELLSANPAIAAKDIVGKAVTWVVQQYGQKPRFFSGIVRRFSAGGRSIQKLRSYRAEVVPALWLLTRSADCRIFQGATIPKILEDTFGRLGPKPFDVADVKGPHHEWEYCVQYRETAFNFVSRLMEQAGIYYYFRHEDGKHTLVLADHKGASKDCGKTEIFYRPDVLEPNHVTAWEHIYEFRSGKWAHTDYNFETPSDSLLAGVDTVIQEPDFKAYELFDYPGEYPKRTDGAELAKRRMEEEEAGYDVVAGSSGVAEFTPGTKFTLEKHEIEAEAGKSYLITSVQHTARDRSYAEEAAGSEYSNRFTCIPDSVTFRPLRVTPKPSVPGPQPAVVVGPPGEEIHTDKYRRIRVHFFWDRWHPKDAEDSSCWIRVSESWAGKGWGMVSTPRIGQEVMVDFLEGDPDRPLVTGRVYNAEQMPHFSAPEAKNLTGLKSNSTKGGGGYNEISFDDSKGKEQVTVHAQYDMGTTVEHDDTQTVHNNRTITVDGTHTETIKKDTTIKITEGNLDHNVVAGTATYHVMKTVDEKFEANQKTTVTNQIEIESTSSYIHMKASDHIQLLVGASKLLMKADGSIELSGLNIAVDGKTQVNVHGGDVISKADTNHIIGGGLVQSKAGGTNTVIGATVLLNP